MLINVTEQDIKDGLRKSCRLCPVALAVRRGLGVSFVEVSRFNIFVFNDDMYSIQTRKIPLPASVGDWISAFDSYCYVGPFSFTVEL